LIPPLFLSSSFAQPDWKSLPGGRPDQARGGGVFFCALILNANSILNNRPSLFPFSFFFFFSPPLCLVRLRAVETRDRAVFPKWIVELMNVLAEAVLFFFFLLYNIFNVEMNERMLNFPFLEFFAEYYCRTLSVFFSFSFFFSPHYGMQKAIWAAAEPFSPQRF